MSKKPKSSQFFKGAKPAKSSESAAQEKVLNTATNSNPVINQVMVQELGFLLFQSLHR